MVEILALIDGPRTEPASKLSPGVLTTVRLRYVQRDAVTAVDLTSLTARFRAKRNPFDAAFLFDITSTSYVGDPRNGVVDLIMPEAAIPDADELHAEALLENVSLEVVALASIFLAIRRGAS